MNSLKFFQPDYEKYGRAIQEDILCVDPAGHTGIIEGSLANDFRSLMLFRKDRKAFEKLTQIAHPLKPREYSKTGVFGISKDGVFYMGNLSGSSLTVVSGLLDILTLYHDEPIIIAERPHPNNTLVNQFLGLFIGAVWGAFGRQVTLAPPRSWGKNDVAKAQRFLKKWGIKAPLSLHEADAVMMYAHIIYGWKLDGELPEETQTETDAQQWETVVDAIRFQSIVEAEEYEWLYQGLLFGKSAEQIAKLKPKG